MPRDDELYALVREDQRIFFPGGHPGKARAVQALLSPGYHAKWQDRSDGKRSCGFVTVHHTDGEWWHMERLPPAAWQTSNASAAWTSLVQSVDASILGSVDARLAERPGTLEDAVSLASAPDTMLRAEALVREAFARAALLGAPECPQILWRAMPSDVCARTSPDRTAFGDLWQLYREALRGEFMDHKHRGRAQFAFSRHGDPPPLLKFSAEDFGEALTFDELRKRAFVSSTGLGFAALENPFESLLRIGRIGILVQEVSPARVVLGTSE